MRESEHCEGFGDVSVVVGRLEGGRQLIYTQVLGECRLIYVFCYVHIISTFFRLCTYVIMVTCWIHVGISRLIVT